MIINDESRVGNCPTNQGKFLCGVVEGFYGRPWTTHQRKRLFARMKRMGMETYIYAPKDDCKHRMYWRDLYTVEEADHLTGLIEGAAVENVTFVYALSPGLDMTYSNAKEVACLKRKLEQVASFGCKAFALLFDDIDVDMCEGDKEIFQSFAQAQVSVTNEVFQHLGQPKPFLFCPTEYCASRAVPNVTASEYLSTIGSKLLTDIDIMWTGPKVISKKISIKSIEELASILKRPPVIWDNIHANDYDQRRLFLGPYDGRSSELIPYLRGVLTNPNCEFDANYIAMHTLAQWSRSNISGLKKDFILSESPVSADIKLETEGQYATDEDIPVNSASGYQPKLALITAIREWLAEFYNEYQPVTHKITLVPPPVNMPVVSTLDGVDPLVQNANVNESYMQPATLNTVNSLVGDSACESEADSGIDHLEEAELDSLPEPMDCAASTSGASTCSSVLTIDPTDSLTTEQHISSSSTLSVGSTAETMQVDLETVGLLSPESQPIPVPSTTLSPHLINPPSFNDSGLGNSLTSTPITDSSLMCSNISHLSEQEVHDLCDMFYTPFEHGTRAVHMLNEFIWLKGNVGCLCRGRNKEASAEQLTAAEEWRCRADDFCRHVNDVCTIFSRFCQVPNKALLYDLFPYIWDLTVVLHQLLTFVAWLAVGDLPPCGSVVLQGSPYSWSNQNFQEHFMSGQQEPWVFRGGLQAEFQRMLPLEGAADLLLMTCPLSPLLIMNKVRPYSCLDEAAVYEVCRRTCDDGIDGTEIFPDQPDLIGDKLVGAFLTMSPGHCFVIEDSKGDVCGYVLSAVNAKDFHKNVEHAWLPALQDKYPNPGKDDDLTPAEEIISSFHKTKTSYYPDSLYDRYTALVRMDVLSDQLDDPTVVRRAMASVVAALKISGVQGIHCEIHIGDQNTAEFYSKLGFTDVPQLDAPEDIHYMGRLI